MLCCVGCRWPLWPTLKRQVRSPLQCTSVQRGNYYGKMSTLHLMADADDFFYLLWLITISLFFASLDHCYRRFPVKKLFEEEDTVTTDAVEDASYSVKRVKTCFFFFFLEERYVCWVLQLGLHDVNDLNQLFCFLIQKLFRFLLRDWSVD